MRYGLGRYPARWWPASDAATLYKPSFICMSLTDRGFRPRIVEVIHAIGLRLGDVWVGSLPDELVTGNFADDPVELRDQVARARRVDPSDGDVGDATRGRDGLDLPHPCNRDVDVAVERVDCRVERVFGRGRRDD